MKTWSIYCDEDIDNLYEVALFNTEEEAQAYFKLHNLNSDNYFIFKNEI